MGVATDSAIEAYNSYNTVGTMKGVVWVKTKEYHNEHYAEKKYVGFRDSLAHAFKGEHTEELLLKHVLAQFRGIPEESTTVFFVANSPCKNCTQVFIPQLLRSAPATAVFKFVFRHFYANGSRHAWASAQEAEQAYKALTNQSGFFGKDHPDGLMLIPRARFYHYPWKGVMRCVSADPEPMETDVVML